LAIEGKPVNEAEEGSKSTTADAALSPALTQYYTSAVSVVLGASKNTFDVGLVIFSN
jgi:hypothetical protein